MGFVRGHSIAQIPLILVSGPLADRRTTLSAHVRCGPSPNHACSNKQSIIHRAVPGNVAARARLIGAGRLQQLRDFHQLSAQAFVSDTEVEFEELTRLALGDEFAQWSI